MLSVGLPCRSILEAETRSLSAALHILRRRESETPSVFAERLLDTAEALEMMQRVWATGSIDAAGSVQFLLDDPCQRK